VGQLDAEQEVKISIRFVFSGNSGQRRDAVLTSTGETLFNIALDKRAGRPFYLKREL